MKLWKKVLALSLAALLILSGTSAVAASGEGSAEESALLPYDVLSELEMPQARYQPGIRMATQSRYDGTDEKMLDIVESEVREAFENGLSAIEIQCGNSGKGYLETLIRYYELGNELGFALELRGGGAGGIQGGLPQGLYYAQKDLSSSVLEKGMSLSGENVLASGMTFEDSLEAAIAVSWVEEQGVRIQKEVRVLDTDDFVYEAQHDGTDASDEDEGNAMGASGGFGMSSTIRVPVTVTYTGEAIELGDGTWTLLVFFRGYDPDGSGMDNTDFYSQESARIMEMNTLKKLGQDEEDPALRVRSDQLLALMRENGAFGGMIAVDGGDSNQILSARTYSPEMFEKSETLYGLDFHEYLAPQYAGYSLGSDLDDQKMRNVWKEIFSYLCQDYYAELQHWAEKELNSGFRAQLGYATELDTGVTTTSVAVADTESYWVDNGGTNYNFDISTGYRQVTSGSHLLRRKITSNCEVAAINGAHGAGFVDWLLVNVNDAVYGGVSNMLYHVYESQAGVYFGYGYDGSMQSFGNSNPQYSAMRDINGYVARLQYVMQNGVARRDIAIYEQVYDATSKVLDAYAVDPAVEEAGYTFDILNPGYMSLENAFAADGVIDPEGGRYKALVVYQPLTVDCVAETKISYPWSDEISYGEKESYLDGQYISLAAAEKFLSYAEAGVPIVVVGDYRDFHAFGIGEEDAALHAVFEQIDTKGMLYMAASGTDIPTVLQEAGVEPDVKKDASSRLVSWEQVWTEDNEGVDAVFYWLYHYPLGEGNAQAEAGRLTQKVSLRGTGTPCRVDLWSGEVIPVTDYVRENDRVVVDVSLAAYDSALYVLVDSIHDGAATENSPIDYSVTENCLADFTLTVESWTSGYGYTAPKTSEEDVIVKTELAPVEITDLTSQTWDALTFTAPDGSPVDGSSVSGIGTYKTCFMLEHDPEAVSLDIGDVYDTVQVYVNEKKVPVNMLDPNGIDISDFVTSGENSLRIVIASDLQNVCLANGSANSARDSVQSYGLYGKDGEVIIRFVN